jgi:hypothetical protein
MTLREIMDELTKLGFVRERVNAQDVELRYVSDPRVTLRLSRRDNGTVWFDETQAEEVVAEITVWRTWRTRKQNRFATAGVTLPWAEFVTASEAVINKTRDAAYALAVTDFHTKEQEGNK